MKTCFLDLDGVLVDFVAGALALHGKRIPPGEVAWDFMDQIGVPAADFWKPMGHDFWLNLDWTVEGPHLLRNVERVFGDNVALMTSPCETPGCVEGKVAWVKRHLFRYSRRLFVGSARHLAAGPGKILIDDNDRNAELFAMHGGKVLLVPRPWNKRKSESRNGLFSVTNVVVELGRMADE